MSVLRNIEEMKYPVKTLKPGVAKSQVPSLLMYHLLAKDVEQADQTMLYLDVIGTDSLKKLVIHIWDPAYEEDNVSTLVCAPGYRVTEQEEDRLLRLCTSGHTSVDPALLAGVVRQYQRWMPEEQLVFYEEDPLMSVLHMYYCLFPGIRQLLFRARLPYLAIGVENLDEVNLLPALTRGSMLDLFEKGFTKKMIHLLNSGWGVQELRTPEKRKRAITVYREFSHRLGGYEHITQSQWLYLIACHYHQLVYDKKLFLFFGHGKDEKLYEEYLAYLTKREKIGRTMSWEPEVNSPQDLKKCLVDADYYLAYLDEKDHWDRVMRLCATRLSYLDYADDRFLVTHPTTVGEIFRESESQRNCLKTMFPEIARGNMDVGFLRLACFPRDSYITFEVRDQEVVQLLGRFNESLDPESREFRWFTDIYMKEKGFQFSRLLQCEYYGIDAAENSGFQAYMWDEDIPFD